MNKPMARMLLRGSRSKGRARTALENCVLLLDVLHRAMQVKLMDCVVDAAFHIRRRRTEREDLQ